MWSCSRQVLVRMGALTGAIVMLIGARSLPAVAANRRMSAPEWLETFGRNPFHPRDRFLTGFGMSAGRSEQSIAEKLAQARDLAIGNLVATMRSRISVHAVSGASAAGRGHEDAQVSDHYRFRVTSSSAARIEGIRNETYYCPRQKSAYAFAWIDRRDAHNRYRRRITRQLSMLEQLGSHAERAASRGATEQARGMYQECRKIIEEIDQAAALIELIGYREALRAEERESVARLKAKTRVAGNDSAGWRDPGLRATAWTNHGADSLRLHDGESIVVYIRSNKPVHVRFYYQLANGATIVPDMMYADYYIGADQINMPVALPDTFSTSPPYGAERMQFVFSEKPFEPLPTVMREIAGQAYQVVVDGGRVGDTGYRGLTKGSRAGPARHSETIHVRVSPRSS